MKKEELKEEFGRWVDAGRPKLWYKTFHGKWKAVQGVPLWSEDTVYVVDNEYAEIRKAFYDGKQIQCLVNKEWLDCPEGEPRWVLPPEDYRVKPDTEPVYEWQWLKPLGSKMYAITSAPLTEEEAEEDWIKFEPSKKERK